MNLEISYKDFVSIYVPTKSSFSSSTLLSILKAFPNDKKPSAAIPKQFNKSNSIFFSFLFFSMDLEIA